MNLKSYFIGDYSVRLEAKIVPQSVYGIEGESVLYYVDVNGRAKQFKSYSAADLYFTDMVDMSTAELQKLQTVH